MSFSKNIFHLLLLIYSALKTLFSLLNFKSSKVFNNNLALRFEDDPLKIIYDCSEFLTYCNSSIILPVLSK